MRWFCRRKSTLLLCAVLLMAVYFLMSPSMVVQTRSYLTSPSGRDASNRSHNFSEFSSRSPSSSSCSCYPRSAMLREHIPPSQYKHTAQRRLKELQSSRLRKASVLFTPLMAQSNSPLQYPTHGYTVPPLTPTAIPHLRLNAERRRSYKVSLKVFKGHLTLNASPQGAEVAGVGGASVTIKCSSLETLNVVLSSVSYTSAMYYITSADLAYFRFEDHEAVFPIVIRQPALPVLFDPGTDVDSQVTITTKTFLRYDKLQVLLDSVRRYYPHIRVVVADDSMDPQAVSGHNVQHYIMPPGKGWFAGRNLAVSQVTTKYFLWVDDDFLFTEETKIERFVEIMEANPELDVLGGAVQQNRYTFSFLYDEGDDIEGGCMYIKYGKRFHTYPGYPQCSVVHGVVNFFLARTDSVRSIGFDPMIKQVGHPEIFVDGLGILSVVSCHEPQSLSISHQLQTMSPNMKKYQYYRHPKGNYMTYRYPIFYFKNNLKCLRF